MFRFSPSPQRYRVKKKKKSHPVSFFCFSPLDRDKAEFVLPPSSLAGAEDLQAEAGEGATGLFGFHVEHALKRHRPRATKRDLHLRRGAITRFQRFTLAVKFTVCGRALNFLLVSDGTSCRTLQH
jgi:hypothetical protein